MHNDAMRLVPGQRRRIKSTGHHEVTDHPEVFRPWPELADRPQLARRKPSLLAQLALGRLERTFAGLNLALRQEQRRLVERGARFFENDDRALVIEGDDQN